MLDTRSSTVGGVTEPAYWDSRRIVARSEVLAGSHCRRTLWSPRHRQLSASISGRHAPDMRKGTAPTVPYPECVPKQLSPLYWLRQQPQWSHQRWKTWCRDEKPRRSTSPAASHAVLPRSELVPMSSAHAGDYHQESQDLESTRRHVLQCRSWTAALPRVEYRSCAHMPPPSTSNAVDRA